MAMNPTDGDDLWLEQALAADAQATAYIADDGFTATLLSRLPAPAALPAWRRPVVVLLWLMAAGAVAALLPDLFFAVFRGVSALIVGQQFTLSQIAVALLIVSATTWSTLVYAMRAE